MDTRFYYTNPKDERIQKEFFDKMLFYNTNDVVCFDRGEPESDINLKRKIYHILDATVFVNRDKDAKAATITARNDSQILEAKVLMERLTGIKLTEDLTEDI